jgi:cation transport regulator
MPYKTNADLPKNISDKLPEHAQTIFLKAFNSAHEQYQDEQTAFKVAWAAVKKEYEKNQEGLWVKK